MQKKLAVITGATKGIGRAVTEAFSREGLDIFICSRNEQDLQNIKLEVEKKHNNKVYYEIADVSKREDVDRLLDKIKQITDAPEILVNNAGLFIPGQVHQEEAGVFEKMINTNLVSVYHITRGLVRGMIQNKRGHIFNMCSTASIMPYVNGGSYCISKFALLGFSKVLREELKPFDIRVTSIMPGATLTASWEGTDLPEERFMKAEDVAEAIISCYKLSERTVVEELLLRPQLGDL